METVARCTARRIAFVAVFSLLFSVHSAQATNSQKETSSKTLIPASANANLEAAVLPPQVSSKVMTLKTDKDGKSYYSDGRLAKERVKNSLKVYTYQDGETYTVYTADNNTDTYTIDQYREGLLFSRLSSDGTYTTFYQDGLMKQKIYADPADVLYVYNYYFDYTPTGQKYISKYETYRQFESGVSQFYSTTKPVTMNDGTLMETVEYADGSIEVKKNGLTMEFTDAAGAKTTYSYKFNNAGEATIQTKVWPNGKTTRINVAKQQAQQNARFKQVVRAAFKSAMDTTQTYTVRAGKKNVYSFDDGVLSQLRLGSGSTLHFSPDGALMSVSDKNGMTVVRVSGDYEYILLG